MSLRLARALFAAAVVVNLAVVYAPSTPGGTPSIPFLDKLVHLLVFALVAWTGRRAGIPLAWLVGLLMAHAVISELVQHFLLPHRSGDPWDALADCAGVVLGVVLPGARTARPDQGARAKMSI